MPINELHAKILMTLRSYHCLPVALLNHAYFERIWNQHRFLPPYQVEKSLVYLEEIGCVWFTDGGYRATLTPWGYEISDRLRQTDRLYDLS